MFQECSGMFQERSACLSPVEASEEGFEECSGNVSGPLRMLDARDSTGSAHGLPMGSVSTCMLSTTTHPVLLHGRSRAPLPRSTHMTPGSGSASHVRSSSRRTGTAREESRSGCKWGGALRRALSRPAGTNHWNRGRSSADRRTKPTLVLTEPRSLFKSSTKDSSLSTFEIVLQRDPPPRLQDDGRRAAYDAGPEGLSVYGSHRKR